MENKMERNTKQIFTLINWFDFLFNQKFSYKKRDLTDFYTFLCAHCLNSFLLHAKQYDWNPNRALSQFMDDKIGMILQNEKYSTLNNDVCLRKLQRHFFIGNKTDYRYLLAAEVLYSADLLGISINDSLILVLRRSLNFFNEKETSKVLECVKNPFLTKERHIAQSFSEFVSFKQSLSEYNKLEIKNIAVCATMSAGKSSFVNALLGYDFLPMRNEATTAKITSVYDNDHAKKMNGFTLQNNEISSINSNLNSKNIDEWNSNGSIDQIVLQGDLDNIGNNGMIVAVHDTPGTNNSGDTAHHDITLNFLQSNRMDAIVIVANAEHLGTTDEKTLLKELNEKIVTPQNIPVIFVLNKADNIDTEKEELTSVISDYKDFLSGIGFTNPIILPVSSKAARLLKISLKNHSEIFTESECDYFPSIVKKFTKRLNLDGGEELSSENSGKITVDGESYEKSDLITALFHTGINRIEKEIESIIK